MHEWEAPDQRKVLAPSSTPAANQWEVPPPAERVLRGHPPLGPPNVASENPPKFIVEQGRRHYVDGVIEPPLLGSVAQTRRWVPLRKRELPANPYRPDAPAIPAPKGLTTWLFEPESFSPIAKIVDDERFSIVCDHLGTPVKMLDDAGNPVWSAQLDSYGKIRKLEGDYYACPFRFPGQYEDREIDLYYNRFRYYDPEAGQYVSQDPIGLAGGLAPYAYVHDPSTWVDPWGLAGKKTSYDIAELQDSLESLADKHLLPKFRAMDPKLQAGYTGSFRTGVVGNPNKATFGQPIDLSKFDIDYWIESDILFKKFGRNLKADPQFREVLSKTPGFEGLKPNKKGFSIKFKPSTGG